MCNQVVLVMIIDIANPFLMICFIWPLGLCQEWEKNESKLDAI